MFFCSAFEDSQNRCVELENERQRIQNDFENFYQQTQEAEKLQKENAANNQNSEPIEQVCRKKIAQRNDATTFDFRMV